MNRIAVKVRPEAEGDYGRITIVHDSAFREANEGRLVWLLRETDAFERDLSLVAEETTGGVVGHILFYPIVIKTDNSKERALTLTPLAVLPGYQKRGVGSELIRRGLEKAGRHGYGSVVVLGNPGYYGRFGFRPARTWNLSPSFRAPRDAFMALELRKDALAHGGGVVKYPREFDGG